MTTQLVFDIETDGFLQKLTKIHCIAIYNIQEQQLTRYTPTEIPEALAELTKADEVIGHFIKGFDLPAISKVYPQFKLKEDCVVTDTLLLSKLIWSDLKERDFKFRKKRPKFPGRLIGSHGLEAWGHRLGYHKGDYAKECKAEGIDPWAAYSDRMGDYCDNDVLLNVKLYERIQQRMSVFSDLAYELEVKSREICDQQESWGVYFDQDKAFELYSTLSEERNKLHDELVGIFGTWFVSKGRFIPKRPNKKLGYQTGCEMTKVGLVEFNPNSRDHIASRLIKTRGWKPKVFTNGGKPQVDEAILSDLKYPEAKLLVRYLMLNKRISQLAEGAGAWLKLVKRKDSRIYAKIDTNGTNTARCTHNSPNLGQVPAVRAEYGRECRELFCATPGWSFVGADASGLELRCLAHYLAKWDGGHYADTVGYGDIHTANQEAAGLSTRDQAKKFIYTLLYGAGNHKIGSIVGKSSGIGKKLREKFMSNLPAFKKLLDAVTRAAKKRGYIKAIDGRQVPIRSEHSALNFLLQSCGAIIMKQAMINYHEILQKQGYIHGKDYRQVLWVHDEWQVECKPGLEDTVGQAMVDGIRLVTEQFDFKCPLDGEYQIGKNWAETH